MVHPTRRRFVALAAGLVATGTAGCTGQADEASTTTDDATQQPSTDTATTTTGSATTAATTDDGGDEGTGTTTADAATVDMITDNEGSYFDPKGLLIEPGTTVRWVNVSGAHTTTAYHPSNEDKPLRIPEGAEPWDSGTFTEPDAVYEVTFETEGVYDYYCVPHEMLAMVGRIVVGSPQDGPGTTEPTELPPAATEALPSVQTIVDEETVAGP